MILLESATSHGHYAYYHLITGVDFPLKRQSEILEYFDTCGDMNFISISGYKLMSPQRLNRVKHYHLLQDLPKGGIGRKVLKKALDLIQCCVGVDRTRNYPEIKVWGIGSAYFDITDEVARYVVSNRSLIERIFMNTFCADEMFLQTIILNSDLYDKVQINKSRMKNNLHIQDIYLDINRAIDWERGNPYVWKREDYEILMKSNCLFARKFDYNNYPEIVDILYKQVLES